MALCCATSPAASSQSRHAQPASASVSPAAAPSPEWCGGAGQAREPAFLAPHLAQVRAAPLAAGAAGSGHVGFATQPAMPALWSAGAVINKIGD